MLGEDGAKFDGKPVYKDVWNEAVLLAPAPLELYKGLPLVSGLGLRPDSGVRRLPSLAAGAAPGDPGGYVRVWEH